MYCLYLQVTNAIKNSLQFNPSGQPTDGPMGISIALSPTQGNPTFKKNAITNASFRAKKLPGIDNTLLMFTVFSFFPFDTIVILKYIESQGA